jgi:predicted RecB family endonuclease
LNKVPKQIQAGWSFVSSRYYPTEQDISEIVCKYFSHQGYNCRKHVLVKDGERFFEADLICEKEGERNIIEIKLAEGIHQNAIREIIARMRIPSLEKSKYYICVPAYSQLSYGTRKLLDNSGIGLIVVGDGEVSISIPAKQTSSVSMDYFDYINNLKYLLARPTSQARNNALEALGSISNYLQTISVKPYPGRIARELLDKLDSMENVAYARLLREFRREYERASTRKSENEAVLRSLKKLWGGKYGKPAGARAFESFDKFEPILKALPGYRDHLVHPFQVFLMGALIIDAHYSRFSQIYKTKLSDANPDSLDFSWLLCSTFHDICYPIQMYEDFNKNFFQDFLESEVSPIAFQAEKLLLADDHLKYIDQLVALYSHFQESTLHHSSWKYDSECIIDAHLRTVMVDGIARKNHAVLSAIALLKKILTESFVQKDLTRYLAERFSTDVCPAALAIALHDENMLLKLIEPISLGRMPLAFLLVYCDLVQESGRQEQQDAIELHSFNCRGNLIESTLVFGNERIFKRKTKEMMRIFKQIRSDELCFQLNLRYSGSARSENSCKPENA